MATVKFLGADAFLILRFDGLDAAFRNDEEFPAGPTYATTIEPCPGFTFESCDGPEHHVLRDLTTRELRAQPVARFAEAHLDRLAHSVIDRFADQREVDLVASFTSVFPFLTWPRRC
ncbi:MAG: hypothetical protein ACERLM_06355 [Acidimicrobiales bacterium]